MPNLIPKLQLLLAMERKHEEELVSSRF